MSWTETTIPDNYLFIGSMVIGIGTEETDVDTLGAPEGREIQTLATRYERKKVNREACIQLKGTRCCVCGFDFADNYGPLGLGYIEIHHTKPVSTIGPDYRLNIDTDLVPLCANCHSMAHREDPPIAVDRLKELWDARHTPAPPAS